MALRSSSFAEGAFTCHFASHVFALFELEFHIAQAGLELVM